MLERLDDVLRRLVETDAVWKDPQRLWYLMPVVPERISQITPFEIQSVRNEMRIGDYRMRFRVQGNRVIVDKIGHRKDVYED